MSGSGRRHYDLETEVLPACQSMSNAEANLPDLITRMHTCRDFRGDTPYVGLAGMVYGLLRVGRVDLAMSSLPQLKPKLDSSHAFAFIDGSAGVICVKALVYCYEIHARAAQRAGKTHFVPSDPDGDDQEAVKLGLKQLDQYLSLAKMWPEVDAAEWLYGRAGYLIGLATLSKAFETLPGRLAVVDAVDGKLIEQLWKALLKEAMHAKWAPSWHGKKYIGGAHGTCGILFALLLFPSLATAASKDIINGLQMVADNAIPLTDTNTPTLPFHAGDRINREGVVHFCHGAPGAALLFLKAAEVFGDVKVSFWDRKYSLLDVAMAFCDTVWRAGALRKGPGLCHGVGGNGYVLYTAAVTIQKLAPSMTSAAFDSPPGLPLAPGLPPPSEAKDVNAADAWYRRARAFCEFLCDEKVFRATANIPDRPGSLFEGWAGAAVFVHDVLRRVPPAFPLFDVADPAVLAR